MPGRMLYLHALSPIHSGTGHSTEVIDLPVAREKITGWPYLPGSAIKGVLRDACDPRDGTAHNGPKSDATKRFETVFGPTTDNASEHAGGLWFADARLLCLPVRSLIGSFAWITCPLALERWKRDHESSGLPFALAIPEVPSLPEGAARILLSAASNPVLAPRGTVYLEDLDLAADPSQDAAVAVLAKSIAEGCFAPDDPWRDLFAARFGIVSDDLFTFLAETGTEVIARIRLEDERKTVAQGGLWYEEAVPAEAIFGAPLLPAPVGVQKMKGLSKETDGEAALFAVIEPALQAPLQIGGSASVGRGLVRARITSAPVGSGQGGTKA